MKVMIYSELEMLVRNDMFRLVTTLIIMNIKLNIGVKDYEYRIS